MYGVEGVFLYCGYGLLASAFWGEGVYRVQCVGFIFALSSGAHVLWIVRLSKVMPTRATQWLLQSEAMLFIWL
jgi:hypothetical protein